jgi:hypothetical protein
VVTSSIYRHQDGEYRWAAGYSLAPDYEHIDLLFGEWFDPSAG